MQCCTLTIVIFIILEKWAEMTLKSKLENLVSFSCISCEGLVTKVVKTAQQRWKCIKADVLDI